MKKTIFLSITIEAAGLLFYGMLNSCGKEESILHSQTTPSEQVQTEADLAFQKTFVAFRDKINLLRNNPNLKSSETMDADDAILYIESLFNATYGFPDERYGKTLTDRAIVTIDISPGDLVLMDDVALVFDEIINIVTAFYHQCNFQNKGFVLLDLSRGETTGNVLSINLRSVVGDRVEQWDPFDSDDYWIFRIKLTPKKRLEKISWKIGF